MAAHRKSDRHRIYLCGDGPRKGLCSIACLPDERYITGRRSGTAIVDTDRVCAAYLDVYVVAKVNKHDVGSRRLIESSPGKRHRAVRFIAGPYHEQTGNVQQTHLTYALLIRGGAAAHD